MIRFDNVCVTFGDGDKAFRAVDEVSLEIKKGDFYGIIGRSGAGKSTLVRTVNLLQQPTLGSVFVEDQRINDLKGRELNALRLKIGMIFQHFNLIKNATVFDNVAFSLKAAGEDKSRIAGRVNELLALVGLSDKAALYPAALSGGQKQRAAIARALANDPEILLCDEATSALDPDTTKEIVALLKQIKAERALTVLFITHQMEVAKQLFNRIALMDHGRVVEEGSTYDIFARPQSELGKALVQHIDVSTLPPELTEHEPNLYAITYKEENAYEGVIAEAIKRFDSDISILGGSIEYIEGKPLGHLLISIRRHDGRLPQVLDFLRQKAFVETILEK